MECDEHYAPSSLFMSIFLIRFANSQSNSHPLVLTRFGELHSRPNSISTLWKCRNQTRDTKVRRHADHSDNTNAKSLFLYNKLIDTLWKTDALMGRWGNLFVQQIHSPCNRRERSLLSEFTLRAIDGNISILMWYSYSEFFFSESFRYIRSFVPYNKLEYGPS